MYYVVNKYAILLRIEHGYVVDVKKRIKVSFQLWIVCIGRKGVERSSCTLNAVQYTNNTVDLPTSGLSGQVKRLTKDQPTEEHPWSGSWICVTRGSWERYPVVFEEKVRIVPEKVSSTIRVYSIKSVNLCDTMGSLSGSFSFGPYTYSIIKKNSQSNQPTIHTFK